MQWHQFLFMRQCFEDVMFSWRNNNFCIAHSWPTTPIASCDWKGIYSVCPCGQLWHAVLSQECTSCKTGSAYTHTHSSNLINVLKTWAKRVHAPDFALDFLFLHWLQNPEVKQATATEIFGRLALPSLLLPEAILSVCVCVCSPECVCVCACVRARACGSAYVYV